MDDGRQDGARRRGEPQTIIAPRALHHTGLRYASNQLYRLVVHESVHHWQIATSRGAVMPVPFLRRDIEVSHQSLVQLWEGHAHWVVQEVARRLFGQDKRPAAQALRRSWRYRRQIELMRWLARRAHGDDVLGQAEGRLHQIRGQGLRWVEAAIEGAGGVGPFNKVWHDPWYAPTADEVTNPERWFSRVGF
ncbi:zinc-dependent metalloprotease [Streptomyces sp. FXJ1.4098]|nr:zinc-dependent metalloprotease [Streptomyces sp. FXJ1.4098]